MSRSLSYFFAPCPVGLEQTLLSELTYLNAITPVPTRGGVGFSGPFSTCYRVNLESRVANRVLWKVYQGSYKNEEDVYHAAYQLPWHTWFPVSCRIKVKVNARHTHLPSLDFLTLRIKDAICDKFRSIAKVRPTIDRHTPDVRIYAFLDDQTFILYLDTSGEPLFKRGLRAVQGEAPLRENLAAGILRMIGWTPQQPLLDPMCGGGTILLEAAQMAHHIAPGLGRRFAFEKFLNFDSFTWKRVCQISRAQQLSVNPTNIYGSDNHASALTAARTNFQTAGLADSVHLRKADILSITPPSDRGILVTNPPYGIRLGQDADLAAFYPRLGDTLKQQFPGWRAYVLTADRRLPKLIRLATSRRTPLFNGPIECRLYEYILVRGENRGRPAASQGIHPNLMGTEGSNHVAPV